MLVREVAATHGGFVAFYEKDYELSREEAVKRANESPMTPEEQLRRLEEDPPDQVSWWTFSDAVKHDPERAWARWARLKEETRDELDSGARGCEVMRQDSPWERARYLAVRQGFIDEWQPRGSLELTLIDQMAQAHTGWLLWLNHFELLAASGVAEQRDQIDRSGKYGSCPGTRRPRRGTGRGARPMRSRR